MCFSTLAFLSLMLSFTTSLLAFEQQNKNLPDVKLSESFYTNNDQEKIVQNNNNQKNGEKITKRQKKKLQDLLQGSAYPKSNYYPINHGSINHGSINHGSINSIPNNQNLTIKKYPMDIKTEFKPEFINSEPIKPNTFRYLPLMESPRSVITPRFLVQQFVPRSFVQSPQSFVQSQSFIQFPRLQQQNVCQQYSQQQFTAPKNYFASEIQRRTQLSHQIVPQQIFTQELPNYNDQQRDVKKTGYIPPTPKVNNECLEREIIKNKKIDKEYLTKAISLGEKFASFLCGVAKDKIQNNMLAYNLKSEIIELGNLRYYPSNFVYNQGDIGSCTANSMAFIIKYLSVINSKYPRSFLNNPERLDISRLFQYYNTRYEEAVINGWDWEAYVATDTGGSMAAGIVSIDKYGACPEQTFMTLEKSSNAHLNGKRKFVGWPYSDRGNLFAKRPDPECNRFALDLDADGINDGSEFDGTTAINQYAKVSQAIGYRNITALHMNETSSKYVASEIVKSLSLNMPVYIGVMLDNTFMNDHKGFITTPNPNYFSATGGHAITIVGYGPYNVNNNKQNYFKFLNSWGSEWGDGGYGYLEEQYVSNVKTFGVEAFKVWLDPKIWKKTNKY